MKAALILALILSACGTAYAQQPTPAASAPSATSASAEEKLVCRSERVTGTRNTKRVCRSAEQIEADKRAGREFTEMGQRKTSAETGGG